MIVRFEPRDPGFDARVRNSINRQTALQTMGITLSGLQPGTVTLEMRFSEKLAQQHGYIHAGVITTAMDSACGYAAFSLMETSAEVLTVEFKANFLAPAAGTTFRFTGHVVKPGRTLTVCEGKAFAINEETEKLIATMGATMMAVQNHSAG